MERGILSLWVLLCMASVAMGVDSYPNPINHGRECGQNSPSYICDPDNFLNTSQVRELNTTIASLKDVTECLCHHKENCHDNTEHVVLVAVASSLPPQYSEASQTAVNGFAWKLYTEWTTDSRKCRMIVVIAYSHQYKLVGTNVNKFGKKVLIHLGDIVQKARQEFFNNGNTYEGLKEVINYCKYALHKGVPVHEFSLWRALGLPIVVSIPVIFFCSLCWICILTCRN